LTPEATVSTQSSMSPRLPFADFQRPASLSPRSCQAVPKSCRDEASTRVHFIHPFGLPLTCSPRTVREPLGFSLSFAPGNYSPRTSGRGPVSDTDRELRLGHQTRPPIDVLTHFVRPRVAPLLGIDSVSAQPDGDPGCGRSRCGSYLDRFPCAVDVGRPPTSRSQMGSRRDGAQRRGRSGPLPAARRAARRDGDRPDTPPAFEDPHHLIHSGRCPTRPKP
jgi:hypothetical protein